MKLKFQEKDNILAVYMDSSLKDLIKISNTVGKDLTLVQGVGGNTSVKTPDGNFMYIKTSGTALKNMSVKKGWRKIDVAQTLSILKDNRLAALDVNRRETEIVNRLSLCCVDDLKNAGPPSIEAHLHAILDRYAIHLHPDIVCAYAGAKDGKAALEKLFKNEKRQPLWVPYSDPGFALAQRVLKLAKVYEDTHGCKPAVLFLEKHGLFVSAGSAEAALKLVRKVIKMCGENLFFQINPNHRKFRE